MNDTIKTPPISPNQATVLIGPNGGGKSIILRQLTLNYLSAGRSVIAIAPTIHDRFGGIRGAGFSFFGARLGRVAAKKAIATALENTKVRGQTAFESLLRSLEYAKFDPIVGVRIPRICMENFHRVAESGLEPDEVHELEAALLSWKKRLKGRLRHPDMVSLSLRYHSFDELESLSFASIARHEGRLKRLKVISKIDYFLLRRGTEIPLLDACSGELSLICPFGFIAANIRRESVIVVDEPENSLHPTWQKDYLTRLFDMFYQYEPTIVIATHSPIVVSAGSVEKNGINVYEVKNGMYEEFQHANLNLEEMYERLFGLVTPKNHYLSEEVVRLLNELNAGDLKLEDVRRQLGDFEKKSYDEKQKHILDSVEKMAVKIENERQK